MLPSLLILDDDPSFLRACDTSLSARYRVVPVRSVQEASELFQMQRFAAVIVDYWLGPETADPFLDLMRQSEIGANHAATPCIVISGNANKELAIKLLNRQVFGFLEKPIQFEHLIEAVDRAIAPMRPTQHAAPASAHSKHIDFVIDLERRQITVRGENAKLTPSELKILSLLVEANGKAVSRDVFVRAIWGREIVSRSALDTHILNLKKKVPAIEPHLHAIYGTGYLLDLRQFKVSKQN